MPPTFQRFADIKSSRTFNSGNGGTHGVSHTMYGLDGGGASLPPNVVFDGHSLFDAAAFDSSVLPLGPLPTRVMATLGMPATSTNLGRSGQDWDAMMDDALVEMSAAYVPGAVNVAVVWEDTNFFANHIPIPSLALCQQRKSDYCKALRNVGWRVVIGTMLDRPTKGAAGQDYAVVATRRAGINSWTVANYTGFADVLWNIGADATLGQTPIPGAYTFDGTHLNDAGNAIAMVSLKAAILSAIALGAQPAPVFGATPAGILQRAIAVLGGDAQVVKVLDGKAAAAAGLATGPVTSVGDGRGAGYGAGFTSSTPPSFNASTGVFSFTDGSNYLVVNDTPGGAAGVAQISDVVTLIHVGTLPQSPDGLGQRYLGSICAAATLAGSFRGLKHDDYSPKGQFLLNQPEGASTHVTSFTPPDTQTHVLFAEWGNNSFVTPGQNYLGHTLALDGDAPITVAGNVGGVNAMDRWVVGGFPDLSANLGANFDVKTQFLVRGRVPASARAALRAWAQTYRGAV